MSDLHRIDECYFPCCNNPRGIVLNNDQRIWLMSAVSSTVVGAKAFVCLPPTLCGVRDERSPFAEMMMMDAARSQLFHWSLHTSWSLTSGISKMNGHSLVQRRRGNFHLRSRESSCRKEKKLTRRKNSLIVMAGNARDHFSCLHKLSRCEHPL